MEKQKDTAQKETLCSFRHDEKKRGKATQSSSLAPKTANSKQRGKILRKGKHSEAVVLLEIDIKNRAKTTSVEFVRFCHEIFGIFTKCRRCKFGGKCSLCTERLTVVLTEEHEWWQRFCCLIEEFQAIGLRIPGYRAAEVQLDSKEDHKILGTRAQRAILRRCISPHESSGKKGSIARSDSAHWFS